MLVMQTLMLRITANGANGSQGDALLVAYANPQNGQVLQTGVIELVHATTPNNATNIVTYGLKPGKDGVIWTITPDGADGPGKGVSAEATVQLRYRVDVSSSAKNIPQNIIDEAQKAANQALKGSDLPVVDRNAKWARTKWDYIVENYIKKTDGDIFMTPNPSKEGKGVHYVFKPSGWNNAKPVIVKISGEGAEAAIQTMMQTMSVADEAAANAAKHKWGNNLKLIGKWGGRTLVVVGAGASVYEIYHAENKPKTITREVGGWTGAGIGAKAGGIGGAKAGAGIAVFVGFAGPQAAAPEEIVTVPVGAGIGGLVGSIGGGISGFFIGREITETAFEWFFE